MPHQVPPPLPRQRLFVAVVCPDTSGNTLVNTVVSSTMELTVTTNGLENAVDDLTHAFGRPQQWSRFDEPNGGSVVLLFAVDDPTKVGEQFDSLFQIALYAVGV